MTENDEKPDLNTLKRSVPHFTVPGRPGRIASILLILLLIAIPVYLSYDIRMQPYDLSGIDARIEAAL